MTSATPPKVGAPRTTQLTAASPMHRMVRIYGWAVIAGFALIPLGLVLYVSHWQPDTLLVRHRLHEVAIAAAVVVGGFISYVTWRCYHYSGEIFLRWVTLGLAGFTLFYFVHGALTVVAKSHVQMFLNFGITARLVLLLCLMVAAIRYRAPPDPPQRREAPGFWLVSLGALAVFAVAVAVFSESALAEEEIERTRRHEHSLSLLAMDVDRFKDINDVYGHQTGDRVLQHFVRVVSDRLRPTDVIGRVGGEEFLVLLPETTLAEARTAAERMRDAVANSRVTTNDSAIGITVRIGVAEFGADAATLDSWLSTADKRLYFHRDRCNLGGKQHPDAAYE